jgi:hypothetical protein
LLHDADLILSNISQTAALTNNPAAATATSPHELSPNLMVQVGPAAFSRLTAPTASPAVEFTTNSANKVIAQKEASSLCIVGLTWQHCTRF